MVDEGNNYTVDEAAGILGLSPVHVHQMCWSGELRAERREERIEGVFGPWRIRKDAVRTLSQDHRPPTGLRWRPRAASPCRTGTKNPTGSAVCRRLDPSDGVHTNSSSEAWLFRRLQSGFWGARRRETENGKARFSGGDGVPMIGAISSRNRGKLLRR